jgi:hypothetical protein
MGQSMLSSIVQESAGWCEAVHIWNKKFGPTPIKPVYVRRFVAFIEACEGVMSEIEYRFTVRP